MDETLKQFPGQAPLPNEGVISDTVGSGENRPPLSRQRLDEILQDPNHTPEQLLSFFDDRFKKDLDSDAGVHEGYTIREHTGMVLGQYKKYFAAELPGAVDPQVFELVLALHDIGKPQAILNGSKAQQHRFTLPIVKETLLDLGFGSGDITFAAALIDGDPIGYALKTGETKSSAESVRQMAANSGLGLGDFWQALQIYYKADASSYTEDAGGQRSLDYLFEFDRPEGSLSFAPAQQNVIDALDRQLTAPGPSAG